MPGLALPPKIYAKAIAVGIATAVVLSAIMVSALKAGLSPMPKPVALAFAQTLLGKPLPLPVGLLFHVAWVTLWSVLYIAFFWGRLTFLRALALAAFLWLLALVVFFPLIGWGLLGLALGPQLIVGVLASHILFAIVLWTLARWAFGA